MREPRPQRLRQRYTPPPPAPTYRAPEQGRICRQRGGGGAPMSLECEEPPPPDAGERPPWRPPQGGAPRVPRSLVSEPVESPQPFFGPFLSSLGFSPSAPVFQSLSAVSYVSQSFPSISQVSIPPAHPIPPLSGPYARPLPPHLLPWALLPSLSVSPLASPPLAHLPQSLLSTHAHLLLPPYSLLLLLCPPPTLIFSSSRTVPLDTPYPSVPVACHPRFHGL